MKEEIFTWLQSQEKDYKTGITYLEELTRNRYLLKQLARKESKNNFSKLIYELTKYTTRETIKGKPLVEPEPPRESKPPPPPVGTIQDKKAVEKLEISLAKMHNKKGILSNTLRNFSAGDNKARRSVLNQIDGLNLDMNSIRTKLDYYNKNGTLPPLEETPIKKKNMIPEEPVKMMEKLLSLRTSRTKIKKQIAASTDQERKKILTTRLNEKINLINQIEKNLNGNR